MNMDSFDDFIYKNITSQLEERDSLEEIQMSRKERYHQRLNRPKPDFELFPTKKRKLWVKDDTSDDDEMPAPTPKIRRRKAAPKAKVVDVIVLDDDPKIRAPSLSPCTSSASSSSTSSTEEQKKMTDKDKSVASGAQPEAPKTDGNESDGPKILSSQRHLRGRLPSWYHTRKAREEELRRQNQEKKEARLKLEKELEERRIEEEKLEERRKRDRERKRQKTLMKRIEGEGSVDCSEKIRENNENLDEKLKKKRADVRHKVTDPSLDPSIISLEAPEIVPWAKRKAPKKSTSSLPSTSASSSYSEDPQASDDPTSLDNLMDNVDFSDLLATPTSSIDYLENELLELTDGSSPLYFNLGEEVYDIPDEDVEPVQIDDNFLAIMNDDSFVLDPVQAFNELG